jgi:hypothetical protein
MSFKAKRVPCWISAKKPCRALHSMSKPPLQRSLWQLLQHPFPKPRLRGTFGAHSAAGSGRRELAHGLYFGERCAILQQRLELALPRSPQVGVGSVFRMQRQACQWCFEPSERRPGA